MTLMSTPDCKRCIAVVWRMMCGEMRCLASCGCATVAALTASARRWVTFPRVIAFAIAVGQQRRCRLQLRIDPQPRPNLLYCRSPQRHSALFAPLAVRMHTGGAVEHHVGQCHADDLGDSGASVEEYPERQVGPNDHKAINFDALIRPRSTTRNDFSPDATNVQSHLNSIAPYLV